jgi:hypothetical protein
VCFNAELIYNVLFILYSSMRGFFPLGFEVLPFRPKFPSHVNPFRAVTCSQASCSQASAARKASPFLGQGLWHWVQLLEVLGFGRSGITFGESV